MTNLFRAGYKFLVAGLVALALPASADTIVSATEVSYDANLRPQCSAVRMNPATFSNAPANACTLDSAGSYGSDRITMTTYDAAGQVTEVDQAYGTSIQRAYARYTYSPDGLKTSEMDANGNKTMYVYDGFNRLSQVQYPSTTIGSGTIDTADYDQFQYDANGNKTSWRRRNGKTLNYYYDALNREVQRNVSDGSVPTVYSDYDLQGHPCIVVYTTDVHTSGPNCTSLYSSQASIQGVHYEYDGMGRVLSTTDMNGRTISYLYDAASNRTRLTYADGNYQLYTYDADNRLTVTTLGGGGVSVSYDNLGRTNMIGKGAASTSFGYDNLSRLTSMGNSVATSGDSTSWSFAYSPASQILNSSASTTAFDYVETASTTTNNTYDGLNRDAGIAAITGGGYDADGNLANDGTRTFTYDVYNHLLSETSGGNNLSLVYDPLGRLASQTYNGVVTSFLYDASNLITEYNGSGAVSQRYVFGMGTDLPLIWFQGSQNSTPLYFVQDYHGSVIGYVDVNANVQGIYKYGPYGEPKDAGNVTDFTGARFRYTGQMVIPEASLYYYKARVYDPIFGRFLQTDPIGSKDDLDLYAYTADDPVNAADPTGNEATGDDDESGSGEALSQPKNDYANDPCKGAVFCSSTPGPGANDPTWKSAGVPSIASAAVAIPAGGVQGGTTGTVIDLAAARGLLAEAGVYGSMLMLSGDTPQVKTIFVTYTRVGPDGLVYSGRTSGEVPFYLNDPAKLALAAQAFVLIRSSQQGHLNDEGFAAGVMDRYSGNSFAIRGREQMLIDGNGGARSSGGTSRNMINGVSPWNPMGGIYRAAAISEFGVF